MKLLCATRFALRNDLAPLAVSIGAQNSEGNFAHLCKFPDKYARDDVGGVLRTYGDSRRCHCWLGTARRVVQQCCLTATTLQLETYSRFPTARGLAHRQAQSRTHQLYRSTIDGLSPSEQPILRSNELAVAPIRTIQSTQRAPAIRFGCRPLRRAATP